MVSIANAEFESQILARAQLEAERMSGLLDKHPEFAEMLELSQNKYIQAMLRTTSRTKKPQ